MLLRAYPVALVHTCCCLPGTEADDRTEPSYDDRPVPDWIVRAADELAGLIEARMAIDEYVEQHGEVDEETTATIERALDQAGVGLPEPEDERRARLAALARPRAGRDEEDAR